MTLSFWRRVSNHRTKRPKPQRRRRGSFSQLLLEKLEDRYAPAITIAPLHFKPLVEGVEQIIAFAFTDSTPRHDKDDYTATIDPGDGSGPQAAAIISFHHDTGTGRARIIHTYAEEGTPTVTAFVRDLDDRDSASRSGTASVADAALTITQLSAPTPVEGTAVTGVTLATFSDADPNGTVSDYTATVTWGDGTVESSASSPNVTIVANGDGTFSVQGTHTYLEEASGLSFQVAVADTGGASASQSTSLSVTDAALAITQLSAPTPVEGSTLSGVTLASFTDADPNGTVSGYTATVTWGDGTVDSSASSPNVTIVANGDGTFSVQGTHTYLEEASGLTFQVAVADAGGASASQSTSLSVTDAALAITQLSAPAPVEGSALSSVTLATFTDADPNGTVSDYTATVTWGDGTVDSSASSPNVTIVANGDGTFSVQGTHTYLEEASGLSFQVAVADAGGASASQSTSLNVTDAALAITQLSAPAPVEGSTLSGVTLASFTDADPNGTVSDYTATVTWGDGTVDSSASGPNVTIVANEDGTFSVQGTHTYLEEASGLTFQVAVADAGGASASQSTSLNVTDAALAITQLSAPAPVEGSTLSGVTLASFTDADPNGTLSDYTATVTWGDGTVDSSASSANVTIVDNHDGTFSVQGTHTYLEEASDLTFQVAVADAGGASASQSTSLSVTDAALTISQLSAPAPVEGSASNGVTLATFSDADPNRTLTDYTATVTWGDGTVESSASSPNVTIVDNHDGTFSVQGTHTYVEEASNLTFQVAVADAGSASASQSTSLSVTDAALTISQLSAPAPVEGSALNGVTLATFSDADPNRTLTDYTATVTWGDGTVESSAASPNVTIVDNHDGTFSVQGTHTYVEEASNLTFQVAVADAGGASASQSTSLSVTDAPLAAKGMTVNTSSAVAISNVLVATFTDGNSKPDIADFSATVSWGDGDSTAGVSIVADAKVAGQFDVLASKSHPYATGSSFPLIATIHDAGGSSATANGTANVTASAISGTVVPVNGFELPPLTDVTVATFTQGQNIRPGSVFSAIINWGDGSSSAGKVTLAGGSYSILGNHTYSDEGTFQINVSVTDGAVSANLATTATILEALLIDGTRGSANQRFISEVYRDLLGRAADLDGLDFWSGMLDQGVSREQVVLRIEGSQEYRMDVVENLYEKLLGRAADPNGLSAWMSFLAQGNSAQLLEARLMASDEYFSRIGGGTNQGFLNAVYHDAFNRGVDPDGAQGWGQQLASGTDRTTVALAILSSLESDQDEVAALYNRLNDRPVDASGLKVFTDLLQSGVPYERAIAEIAGSDPATGGTGEYFAKTVR